MQDDLADLIARVEAGTAEQQWDLLEAGYEAVFGIALWPDQTVRSEDFIDMLATFAFVDAALMMVPEPKSWAVGQHGEGIAGASVFLPGGAMFKAEASTPALALTAAILRARMSDDAR